MKIKYITGYAGTGKSTMLQKQLDSLNPKETVVLAPTHKALDRIMRDDDDILYKTIHSLLQWIPGINEKAKNINEIDITIKKDRDIEHYKNIVIDEGGMISEDMFMSLISKIEEKFDYDKNKLKDINITVYLDPYQLLPVKGKQMQVDPENTINLTTQYRSDAKDIIETYTKFVKFLQGKNTKDLTIKYSDNILSFDISKFKQGDRILAYTNLAVGNYNKQIAKLFGIKSYIGQEVQLGNMLDTVIVDDFINPSVDELIELYLTNRLILQNSKINKNFIVPSLKSLKKNVKFIVSGDLVYPVIPGIYEAYNKIKKVKEEAIKNRSKFTNVYAVNRAFIMDYTFASTVHKAQGSEFNNVFIDKKDIQKSIYNKYYDTYARLMYVALSRAKNKIYI